MPLPREWLRDVVIDEVSLVDEGDNPPALISLFKRARSGEVGEVAQRVRDLLRARESAEQIEKRLFDEIRQDRMGDQIVEVIRSRIDDLSHSVWTILFVEQGDQGPAEDRIRETIGQFVGSIDTDLAAIMAGRIVKRMGGLFRPDVHEVASTLAALFQFQPPDKSTGSTQEGHRMDLSKLSPEDRAAVEAAVKKSEEQSAQIATLTADIAKLKGTKDEPKKLDPLEGLPEAIRKSVEPLLKAAHDRADRAEAQAKAMLADVSVLKASAARAAFAKSVGDLEGMPEPREALIEKLWKIEDESVRAELVKSFEAQAAAIRRSGGLFDELGTALGDAAPEGDAAYMEICKLAEAMHEKNPAMSIEQCRVQVMRDNPDLYEDYRDEQNVN